jgi:hypothetical protein
VRPLEWKPNEGGAGVVARIITDEGQPVAETYAGPDGTWCVFMDASASSAEGYEPTIDAAKKRAEAVLAALLA